MHANGLIFIGRWYWTLICILFESQIRFYLVRSSKLAIFTYLSIEEPLACMLHLVAWKEQLYDWKRVETTFSDIFISGTLIDLSPSLRSESYDDTKSNGHWLFLPEKILNNSLVYQLSSQCHLLLSSLTIHIWSELDKDFDRDGIKHFTPLARYTPPKEILQLAQVWYQKFGIQSMNRKEPSDANHQLAYLRVQRPFHCFRESMMTRLSH